MYLYMFLNPILYLDILSMFLMTLWIILESNKMWHHGISWWPVVSHVGKRRRSRLRWKNVVLRLVAKWAWQILPGKSGLVLDLNLIYIYTYSFFGCVFWRVDIGVCRVQMWGRSSKIACFLNFIQKSSLAMYNCVFFLWQHVENSSIKLFNCRVYFSV